MSVIRTDKWIAESHGIPIKVCKFLTQYFDAASASDIHYHLMMHGMYITAKQGREFSKKLQTINVWEVLEDELEQLRSKWNGPSVPVFTFPSDPNNKHLINEFNGKSGLAYADKVFLFISPHNTETEIRALLTHEYNHVCRLNRFPKRENKYTLLDSIILEGLAEQAVEERFGKDTTSRWTSLYSDERLATLWKEFVYPNRNYVKGSEIHDKVLYGFGHFPKMAGYSVGYYLIRNFLNDTDLNSGDLLAIPSSEIARLS